MVGTCGPIESPNWTNDCGRAKDEHLEMNGMATCSNSFPIKLRYSKNQLVPFRSSSRHAQSKELLVIASIVKTFSVLGRIYLYSCSTVPLALPPASCHHLCWARPTMCALEMRFSSSRVVGCGVRDLDFRNLRNSRMFNMFAVIGSVEKPPSTGSDVQLYINIMYELVP